MNFKDLQKYYTNYFSIGYLNPQEREGHSSFEQRIILISLINFITYKAKLKDPDASHYSILMKLNKNLNLPENFIKGLAIVCEDFSYQCHDFPTFGLKGQDIIKEVISILKSYTPF